MKQFHCPYDRNIHQSLLQSSFSPLSGAFSQEIMFLRSFCFDSFCCSFTKPEVFQLVLLYTYFPRLFAAWSSSSVMVVLSRSCRWNVAQIIRVQGPVVQRPISSNPGLNFNPAFFISLFKSLFGKIFTILFRTSNDQIASKKIWIEFSLKVFRPEIKFHTNPGLP